VLTIFVELDCQFSCIPHIELIYYIYKPYLFVGGLPLHRTQGERDNYSKFETLVGGIMFSAYKEILNLSPLLMSVVILLKFQLVSSVIQDFIEKLRDSGQEICRRL